MCGCDGSIQMPSIVVSVVEPTGDKGRKKPHSMDTHSAIVAPKMSLSALPLPRFVAEVRCINPEVLESHSSYVLLNAYLRGGGGRGGQSPPLGSVLIIRRKMRMR